MARKKQVDDESKQLMRQKIENDTRAFLEAGGEITQIPSGKSGVDFMKPGQKQIKLGNSNSRQNNSV